MVALPMVLSPLLISATRPPALDSLNATCSLEEAATLAPAQTEGANVAYRRATGVQAGSSSRAGAAENEVSSFVRDRWNAVRRLVRANPYFINSTPEQQAEAEALCLAQLKADSEMLLAQAASSDQPQIIPSLPDLGEVFNQLPTRESPASELPTSEPPVGELPNSPAPANNSEPTLENLPEPTIENLPEPAIETLPEPAVRPAAAPVPRPTPPATDPALPAATDPSTYMGPEGNPTPFDGSVIRTLSDFPDGNYRYISGAAEERAYSNEELRQRGGSVFVLKKAGDTITGDLLPRIGLPGICVSGTVSGNVVTGAAYPYNTTDRLQDSARQIGETYEPYGSGALKIRRTRTEGDRLYYAGALLDLAEFTPINAGSSLPPTGCQIGPTGGRDQG